MNMYERLMNGKLFTDMCEGMPQERMQGKRYMKEFNDSAPDELAKRSELIAKMLK